MKTKNKFTGAAILCGLAILLFRFGQGSYFIENFSEEPVELYLRGGWALPLIVEAGTKAGGGVSLTPNSTMTLELDRSGKHALVTCEIKSGPSTLHVKIERDGSIECYGF